MKLQDRTKGLLIALFGVICITPDAVLVRYLTSEGVDPWTIVFWKMAFSLPLTVTYALYDIGGLRGLVDNLKSSAGLYLAALIPQAAVNVGFTFSFVHTTAAHALLLINLNPLWCALMGRVGLGDKLPVRTIVALVLAMGCMILTFVPEIVINDDDGDLDETNNEQRSTTKGNIISLLTGLTIALYITFVRKGGMEGRNMIAVCPMASLVASGLAIIMQRGEVGSREWEPSLWKFWMPMLAEGTMVGIAFIAIATAPRLITGAELALVLLLEVILGPLWVFLAYGETPSPWTLIGGLTLVLVLALHEVFPLILPQKMGGDQDNDNKEKSVEREAKEIPIFEKERGDSESVDA